LGLVASCKTSSTADKVDAGQRKYCNGAPTDGGLDTFVREGGTADVLANSPELGSGGDAIARDSFAAVVDGPAGDLRGTSGEVGVVDSGGGLDLTSSDALNGANDVGGTGGSGGGGGAGGGSGGIGGGGGIGSVDAHGPDGSLDSRADGGIDASPDLVFDAQADTHLDAQADVYLEAQADGPAVYDAAILLDIVAADTARDAPAVVDLAPDISAGTCSINYAVSFNPALASMGVGPDGTLWTTGSIYNPFNFGAGTVSSSGGADVYLNKVNPTTGLATASFTFGFSGGGDQIGNAVAVAGNGNVGLVGQYAGEIDFDSQGNNSLSGFSKVAGAAMGFYAVFSGASSGTTATFINAHNVDVGTGALLNVASNPNQNSLAICGKTSALVLASTKASGLLTSTTDTYGGSMDIVVAVVSAVDGTITWGRQFGGVGDQVCESLAMDNSGNVIMGGTYNGALTFDTHALPTVATTGLSLPFVAILNSSGVATAAATWGTSGISDIYGIAVDSSSNVIIGGAIGANIDFGGSPDITITDRGRTDAFVAKLNSSLIPQWAFSYGDATYDQAVKALAVASTGDVYIGGGFEGTLNGLNGLTDSGNSNPDAFTAHLAGADGSVLCAQSYGDAAGTQQVTAVTVASAATGALANSVMIGGSFQNTITLGSTTLLSPGTPACSVDTDCVDAGAFLTCSHGYCVSATGTEAFISRLGP